VRAVVQRARSASVTVDGEVVGSFDGPGVVVLLGVTHDDGPDQVAWMARKIWGLRILRDEQSASDVGAPLLVVSQFTLYGDTRRGRRPSWAAAAPPDQARGLVEAFAQALRDLGAPVATGQFAARMQVELVNDGPVTLLIET
jgi:D-aminoacyl-tRNA deacylase